MTSSTSPASASAAAGRRDIDGVSSENIVALCDADLRAGRGDHQEAPERQDLSRLPRDARKGAQEHRRGGHRRPGSHPRPGGDHGHEDGQARLLREAHGPHDLRGPAHDPGREGDRRRHADGQPGPRRRGPASVLGVHPRRGDRHGQRGPRLERPRRHAGAGLVAAGHRPAPGQRAGSRRASTGTCGSVPPGGGRMPSSRTAGAARPPTAPFNWRGWWDFGCGAIGDMAVHNADPAFFALDLGAPTAVEAETSPVNDETLPVWNIITFDFPAKGDRPAVKMTWYDGAKLPPRPAGSGRGPQARRQRDSLRRRQGLPAGRQSRRHASDHPGGQAERVRPAAEDAAEIARPSSGMDRRLQGGQARGRQERILVRRAVRRGAARRQPGRAAAETRRVGCREDALAELPRGGQLHHQVLSRGLRPCVADALLS